MIAARSVWIAARARNAARRVWWIGAFGAAAATLTGLALVFIPRAADRQLALRIAELPPAPDSIVLRRALDSAQAQYTLALRDTSEVRDSAARDSTTAVVPTTPVPAAPSAAPPVAPPSQSVERDSATTDLAARIRRARRVPLLESYRALAASELLRGDSGVRALLDSINAIERDSNTPPVTDSAGVRAQAPATRISMLGHALVRLAERRIAPVGAGPDTVMTARVAMLLEQAADSARRDTLARRVVEAESRLRTVRELHASRDSLRASLEAQFRPSTPAYAVALAALIVGLVAGYGAVLARELKRPTVGDATEVERLTGAAVFVHSPDTPSMVAGRSRWTERPGVPRIIDRTSDTYVLLHLALSGVGDAVSDVDVVAADHAIGAAVALGTAATAAGESRAVLVVEGAGRSPRLADLLHTSARTPVAAGRRGADVAPDAVHAVHAVTLDRDARIDVILAGAGDALGPSLAARYDLRIYLVANGRQGDATPHDVIVCARPGNTTLAWLSHVVTEAKHRQQRVRAVVLWNRERPRR